MLIDKGNYQMSHCEPNPIGPKRKQMATHLQGWNLVDAQNLSQSNHNTLEKHKILQCISQLG